MNLRKTFFILPNLFTLANVFCGFFALTLCAGEASIDELYQASLAICFGFFFDLFDGRVARLTRTQSELGMQLDSLADAITFGAAPAMLVYKWGLSSFGLAGVFIAFSFVAAGVLRLARFNVLSARKEESKVQSSRPGAKPVAVFVGLPIPAAASVIVALVVVNYRVGGNYAVTQGAIGTVVVILAYLMISRVRFRSFKDLRITKKSLGVIFLLGLVCMLIVMQLRASFIFIFLISAYIALGLSEEVVRYAAERRRARREAKLRAGEPLGPEDEDEIDDEDEVLRELSGEDGDDDDVVVPDDDDRPAT
ncbi:MAG: CDP-diacylglycerol--serine O-phosphatidyltransferase [Proteobacteria bacterium]|nr:MAG: CDP-diacylglycerol--serine O-phosphatidyltransferase [Pseudomonadota bacterium]PIE18218.1 MAG: CDP-diacylglycerol--serine O-phosphatidyltransferase [Pseudomonadota bacterium]